MKKIGRPPIHETEEEQKIRVAKGETDVKPMLGQKFGRLTVVEFVRTNNRKLAVWKCLCECGTEVEYTGYHLRQGRHKSCGCLSLRKSGPDNWKWAGHGDISGSYWHRVRQGAKSRKLPLQITIEEAWQLFQQQGGRCALTNVEIKLCPSDKSRRSDLNEQTASLDRIDSKGGYVRGNVQWVHKIVNTMKMDMNEDEFIKWCYRVGSGPKVSDSVVWG